MSESAPTRPDERFHTVARSRVGGVRVERLEGLRAGEAIAAVRRLGLRPAPERVEGYEPGLHGFVVGQEPAEGGELAAGDQVVLLIAAPPRACVNDDDRQPAVDEEPVSAPDAPPLRHVNEEVDVEALHVAEVGCADETIEVHELAPAAEEGSPGFEESFEDRRLDRSARGHESRALVAAARSWWRNLSAAKRWVAAGVGVGVALIAVVALSSGSGTSVSRRWKRGVSPIGRSVKVAGRAASARLEAVETGVGRAGTRAERCRGRRRHGRFASHMRVRVVYVSAASAPPLAPAVAEANSGTPPANGAAVNKSAEHVAREFGDP